MKKYLYLLTLIAASILAGCSDSDTEQGVVGVYMSDLSSEVYPSGNTWTILDTYITKGEVPSPLWSALSAANEEGRTISLIFPAAQSVTGVLAMDTLPAVKSIDFPMATTFDNGAFYKCEALVTANLPAATTISHNIFYGCTALRNVSLATNDNVVIKSMGLYAFDGVTTSNITLTIGSANGMYVSDNKLSIDSFSATFKEIKIVDNE